MTLMTRTMVRFDQTTVPALDKFLTYSSNFVYFVVFVIYDHIQHIPQIQHLTMNQTEHLLTYCTTRDAAEILGISQRTAQLWVESGLLEAWKTKGGHRRISRTSVRRLLDDHHLTRQSKELLAPTQRPTRVLVVESNPISLNLRKRKIDSWNLPLEVITANNVIDALIRIGKETPDLMIIDLLLPGTNGLPWLRSLAESAYHPGMEIIAWPADDTAKSEAHDSLPNRIQSFSKAALDFTLQTVLKRLVERRTTQQ